mgnify:CR=1 FL=1
MRFLLFLLGLGFLISPSGAFAQSVLTEMAQVSERCAGHAAFNLAVQVRFQNAPGAAEIHERDIGLFAARFNATDGSITLAPFSGNPIETSMRAPSVAHVQDRRLPRYIGFDLVRSRFFLSHRVDENSSCLRAVEEAVASLIRDRMLDSASMTSSRGARPDEVLTAPTGPVTVDAEGVVRSSSAGPAW